MHFPKRKGVLSLSFLIAGSASYAATFGTVVPVHGTVSDVALDERHGRLYIANLSANRVEVMNTSDRTLGTPLDVSKPPSSVALSPDNRYLVVGIDNNFGTPTTNPPDKGGYWIFDLDAGLKQLVSLPDPVLSVAFGAGGSAMLVTTTSLLLLDPATARTITVPIGSQSTNPLPVPLANFPGNIVQASAGVSGDGLTIVVLTTIGVADPKGTPTTAVVYYRVNDLTATVFDHTSSPVFGPRVVSVDQTGNTALVAWALIDKNSVLRAQFPAAKGLLNVGGHAFDYVHDRILAHVPAPGDGSVWHVMDSDNLTVRERVQIPQDLAGRSVWSQDRQTLYAISVSGVTIFSMDKFDHAPRVLSLQEDIPFQDETCINGVISHTVDLADPNGQSVDFTLSLPPGTLGVRLSQTSGRTPASVRIDIDPTVFSSSKGTTAILLSIQSDGAINLPPPVRILINTRDASQQGRIVNIPGKITDILADRTRKRVYITRQDKNAILVYDTDTFKRIGLLRTGNTPVGMAITTDQRYLISGNDNSQIASVFDLESLTPSDPIIFPPGHYPRSVAVSNGAILALTRTVGKSCVIDTGTVDTGGKPVILDGHAVDRIDMRTRVANTLPSLGVYRNCLPSPDGVLAATPGNNSIFAALPDGTVILYDASADTFVVSRKDFTALGGGYAALNENLFLVDTHLLDPALVPRANTTGSISGAGVSGGTGLRTTTGSANGAGMIERIDLNSLGGFHGVLTVEAPLLSATLQTPPVGQIGETILPFTRTLAVPTDQSSIILLTVSGLTVLSANFDSPVPSAGGSPQITGVVNAADGTSGIASGGLILIQGSGLASSPAAASGFPLPLALGGSCVSVRNSAVPLINVSQAQIVAQLPFDVVGDAPLVVRSVGGGASNSFSVKVQPFAPAIFLNGQAGDQTGLATIVRLKNDELATFTNPIHPDETISIYLTGLGVTTPTVRAGDASPGNPLARAATDPTVSLGGTALTVTFAGLVPGLAGVYQIDAQVPRTISSGAQSPLVITQGAASTTIPIRVVNP